MAAVSADGLADHEAERHGARTGSGQPRHLADAEGDDEGDEQRGAVDLLGVEEGDHGATASSPRSGRRRQQPATRSRGATAATGDRGSSGRCAAAVGPRLLGLSFTTHRRPDFPVRPARPRLRGLDVSGASRRRRCASADREQHRDHPDGDGREKCDRDRQREPVPRPRLAHDCHAGTVPRRSNGPTTSASRLDDGRVKAGAAITTRPPPRRAPGAPRAALGSACRAHSPARLARARRNRDPQVRPGCPPGSTRRRRRAAGA